MSYVPSDGGFSAAAGSARRHARFLRRRRSRCPLPELSASGSSSLSPPPLAQFALALVLSLHLVALPELLLLRVVVAVAAALLAQQPDQLGRHARFLLAVVVVDVVRAVQTAARDHARVEFALALVLSLHLVALPELLLLRVVVAVAAALLAQQPDQLGRHACFLRPREITPGRICSCPCTEPPPCRPPGTSSAVVVVAAALLAQQPDQLGRHARFLLAVVVVDVQRISPVSFAVVVVDGASGGSARSARRISLCPDPRRGTSFGRHAFPSLVVVDVNLLLPCTELHLVALPELLLLRVVVAVAAALLAQQPDQLGRHARFLLRRRRSRCQFALALVLSLHLVALLNFWVVVAVAAALLAQLRPPRPFCFGSSSQAAARDVEFVLRPPPCPSGTSCPAALLAQQPDQLGRHARFLLAVVVVDVVRAVQTAARDHARVEFALALVLSLHLVALPELLLLRVVVAVAAALLAQQPDQLGRHARFLRRRRSRCRTCRSDGSARSRPGRICSCPCTEPPPCRPPGTSSASVVVAVAAALLAQQPDQLGRHARFLLAVVVVDVVRAVQAAARDHARVEFALALVLSLHLVALPELLLLRVVVAVAAALLAQQPDQLGRHARFLLAVVVVDVVRAVQTAARDHARVEFALALVLSLHLVALPELLLLRVVVAVAAALLAQQPDQLGRHARFLLAVVVVDVVRAVQTAARDHARVEFALALVLSLHLVALPELLLLRVVVAVAAALLAQQPDQLGRHARFLRRRRSRCQFALALVLSLHLVALPELLLLRVVVAVAAALLAQQPDQLGRHARFLLAVVVVDVPPPCRPPELLLLRVVVAVAAALLAQQPDQLGRHARFLLAVVVVDVPPPCRPPGTSSASVVVAVAAALLAQQPDQLGRHARFLLAVVVVDVVRAVQTAARDHARVEFALALVLSLHLVALPELLLLRVVVAVAAALLAQQPDQLGRHARFLLAVVVVDVVRAVQAAARDHARVEFALALVLSLHLVALPELLLLRVVVAVAAALLAQQPDQLGRHACFLLAVVVVDVVRAVQAAARDHARVEFALALVLSLHLVALPELLLLRVVVAVAAALLAQQPDQLGRHARFLLAVVVVDVVRAVQAAARDHARVEFALALVLSLHLVALPELLLLRVVVAVAAALLAQQPDQLGRHARFLLAVVVVDVVRAVQAAARDHARVEFALALVLSLHLVALPELLLLRVVVAVAAALLAQQPDQLGRHARFLLAVVVVDVVRAVQTAARDHARVEFALALVLSLHLVALPELLLLRVVVAVAAALLAQQPDQLGRHARFLLAVVVVDVVRAVQAAARDHARVEFALALVLSLHLVALPELLLLRVVVAVAAALLAQQPDQLGRHARFLLAVVVVDVVRAVQTAARDHARVEFALALVLSLHLVALPELLLLRVVVAVAAALLAQQPDQLGRHARFLLAVVVVDVVRAVQTAARDHARVEFALALVLSLHLVALPELLLLRVVVAVAAALLAQQPDQLGRHARFLLAVVVVDVAGLS
ncbi:hypothetical protein GN244_ATG17916 [Phytophthora infestans]|uniref:Uncharacterized protein n=1 Tax=Phytophthora infestans TaxID=4787 RepID=A0A833SGI8_PHYIN|nr:hypothetical protein GN244_ATG17916 [Phytophthora infestans]